MFTLALLIGVFSYLIFFLGIFGLLYKVILIPLVFIFFGLIIFINKNKFILYLKSNLRVIIKNKYLSILVFLFSLQAFINLIGVLGPERGFDALWYHLTLPKLYLENHSVFFIPGGLLYYSAMPKLTEMLYVAGLSLGNEIIPKLIHFSFGLLTCLALYKLQRKFFNSVISLIGVIIFYSNLVVGWESVTAYVDLVRAFFEVMALWAFVNWWEKKRIKWLIISALMVGLAITTKLLAIGSLLIFIVLIIMKGLSSRATNGSREIIHDNATRWHEIPRLRFTSLGMTIRCIVLFCFIALIVPFPWFVFSYLHTGNPVYPFFTDIYKVTPESLSFFSFFGEIWNLFTNSPDHLSLIYIIFFPFVILFFTKFSKELKLIVLYSVLAIILWYLTPRTGGGRFIVPYLPALSIVCAGIINYVLQNKKMFGRFFGKILIGIVVILSLFSIGYRFAANYKYLPVLFGQETKSVFLTKYLNFNYGDFYDIDGYFANHIKSTDVVLLYGFHNLYYVDFLFIDSSWVKRGDKFNYIATQKIDLPKRFKDWELVYKNDKTMVKLYKPVDGLCKQKCTY